MKENPEEITPFHQMEEAVKAAKRLPILLEDLEFLAAEMAKAEAGRQKLYRVTELMQSMYKSDKLKMAESNLASTNFFTMPLSKEDLAKSSEIHPANHLSPVPPIPAAKPIANRIKRYIMNIYKELYYIFQGNGDKGRR